MGVLMNRWGVCYDVIVYFMIFMILFVIWNIKNNIVDGGRNCLEKGNDVKLLVVLDLVLFLMFVKYKIGFFLLIIFFFLLIKYFE